jgi:hypothetical protein
MNFSVSLYIESSFILFNIQCGYIIIGELNNYGKISNTIQEKEKANR